MTAPYFQNEHVTLYNGDCIEMMRALPDNSVHAVVTDPPYGLEFMGREWDGADGFRRSLNAADAGRDSVFGRASRTSPEYKAGELFGEWTAGWAAEAFRVLKPGGHLLAFGGSRTWHRLAVGIEEAGFELRDSIAWLYGSGFPKSKNLNGEWEGWGTALKPAFEPIVVARKPLAGTVAANVLAHGTGALNIDASRIHTEGSEAKAYIVKRLKPGATLNREGGNWRPEADDAERFEGETKAGRWPTNVLLDDSQAAELDKQSGVLTSGIMPPGTPKQGKPRGILGEWKPQESTSATYGDSGGASRFFPTFRYEAKAPQSERPEVDGVQHPTVKPLDLMRWLVKLVTPPGGTVLEPFAGSGTTVEACLRGGFTCIAIEREADYLPLIMKRIRKDHAQSLFGDDWGGAA